MQEKLDALSTVAEETPLSAARSEAPGPGSDGETAITDLLRLIRLRRQAQVALVGLPLHEENITWQWTAILEV
jgi:hypothetical protein